jgi:hypothetical protein
VVSYAKRTVYSVSEVIQQDYLQDLFHLPLSQPAYDEFVYPEDICSQLQYQFMSGNTDTWTYIWGSSDFSSKQAYLVMMGTHEVIPHFS